MNPSTSTFILGEEVQFSRYLLDNLKSFAITVGMTISVIDLSTKHSAETYSFHHSEEINTDEIRNVHILGNIELHLNQPKTAIYLTRDDL